MGRGDVERRAIQEARVTQSKLLRCKPYRIIRQFHIFPLFETPKKETRVRFWGLKLHIDYENSNQGIISKEVT